MLELYADPDYPPAQPLVARIYQAGVQVGADIAMTPVTASNFTGTIPTSLAANTTNGYGVIYVDNDGLTINGGTFYWNGNQEVPQGTPSLR